MKQYNNDKKISELKNEINHNDNKEILRRYESAKKGKKKKKCYQVI